MIFWLAIEDIETFNAVAEPFELRPTHAPADARQRGRYVLENDERIDVFVARSLTTLDGRAVEFEAPGVVASRSTMSRSRCRPSTISS